MGMSMRAGRLALFLLLAAEGVGVQVEVGRGSRVDGKAIILQSARLVRRRARLLILTAVLARIGGERLHQ
jgi:hypothetical protein